jgi:hypothetical protein
MWLKINSSRVCNYGQHTLKIGACLRFQRNLQKQEKTVVSIAKTVCPIPDE